MSERATALVAEFDQQVIAFRQCVEQLNADERSLTGVNTPGPRFMDTDEARSLNVIAYHVPSFLPRHVASARARALGEVTAPVDAHAINAAEALERAQATSAEALARLDDEAPKAREFLLTLTDAQLDRVVRMPFGEIPLEQLIRMVLIGHFEAHRKSIEATVRAGPGP